MAVIIINPNSTVSMTEGMVAAAQAAAPGLAFEGWTSELGPPSIQGPEDGDEAAPHLLRLVRDAQNAKADGIIIGCFDDTALSEAAAIAECPVVGLGHAAYHYAALRQWRFSVVTTLAVSVPILEANIKALGLRQYMAKVRASNVPVLALEDDPSSASALILAEASDAQANDDISAVILGCAGMVQVTEAVEHALEIETIDPVVCAARSMMWLA